MFLFNSLHQGTCKVPGSLASKSRKAFVLAVMFCLSTALLFTGCSTDPESEYPLEQFDPNLIETWISTGLWGVDGYIITNNHISYGYVDDSIDDISYAGTIRYASQFTSNAGVIIIEYDADKKASYWEYDNDYNPTTELPLKGDFIGIYYKSLKPGVSVQMATAYIDGGAEERTIDKAKRAFTAGNEGSYIYSYGTYSKQ